MPPSSEDLALRFVELVEQMNRDLRSQPPEAWSDIELTMPQVRALMLLGQGPQRMSAIATSLGTSVPSASTMMERLVQKALVERFHDEKDRRVVTCRLTEAGAGEMQRFWRVGRLRLEEMARCLTHDELRTVVRAMEILACAVHRQQAGSENEVVPG